MRNRIVCAILSILGLSLLPGCSGSGQVAPEIDSRVPYFEKENIFVEGYVNKGTRMQRFYQLPKRIVVVGFSELETLLAFGLTERIALASSYYELEGNILPHLAKKAEQLKHVQYATPDKESVLMYEPDLVVAQQCFFTPSGLGSTEFWNDRGVPTFVPLNTNNPRKKGEKETIEKEIAFLQGIGGIFQKEELADEFVREIRSTISDVRAQIISETRPRVLVVEFMGKQIVSYDQTKLAGNMVESLGGEILNTEAVISLEDMIACDPDVIFVVYSDGDASGAVKRIQMNPALQELRAVKNHRIHSIQLEYVYSSEIRTAEGLRLLAKGMYPHIVISRRG